MALGALALAWAQEGRMPVEVGEPDERGAEWAPLVMGPSGELRLRGTIAGVDSDMLLDSGAGMTVVDRELVRRVARASGGGFAEGSDVDGPRSIEALRVSVGSVGFTLPRAIVLDFSTGRAELNEPSGIIGRDVFERFVVDVDSSHRRIALREPAEFSYSGPGSTLGLLRGDAGEILVWAAVEELPPARFRVETGTPELRLAAAFVQRHGLLRERAPVSQALGRDGSPVHVATLRSFSLGDLRFTEVPATFQAERSSTPAADESIAGSIGAELLARFRTIVDLSRGRMHLEPAQDWSSRPFARNRLGLMAAPGDASFEVVFVAPGGPAERAGWKAGERILAWNDRPATPASWAGFLRSMSSPPGAVIELVDAEGRVRTLVAADYY